MLSGTKGKGNNTDFTVLGSLNKSFILDTRDLTSSELKKNQLKRSDTMKASDHLPIIIDINLKDQNEKE